ncbi:GreA/GreB family elongation factor [Chromatiaceae bacterium AAb-1]|nr:GreA/GreB family elongation factor [Chromatiaceae bacterium AAb-1]
MSLYRFTYWLQQLPGRLKYFCLTTSFMPLTPVSLAGTIHQLAVQRDCNVLSRPLSVGLGSSVLITELPTEEKNWVKLVEPQNSAPERGLVSVLSPLGRALLGKVAGEVAEVWVLRRKIRFLLCDVLNVRRHQAFPGPVKQLKKENLP